MIPTRIVPCTLIASMGVDRRQLVAAQMLARAGRAGSPRFTL